MRKSYVLLLARCVAVALCWVSASASAGSIIQEQPIPVGAGIQWGQAVCWVDLSGARACPDGPWVTAHLPDLTPVLGAPRMVSFDSQNLFVGAHLVNAQGAFSVSLTPSFDLTNPVRDELQISLADNQSILAVSQHGRLEFTANPGANYFLLLDGMVRPAIGYSLSVSAVPEPASGMLFAAGMALIAYRAKRNSRRQA